MKPFLYSACAAALVILSTGCMSSRTTTTPRTAVEVALLTQSANDSLRGLEVPEVKGRTYKTDETRFEAVEKNFLISLFHEQILKGGAKKTVGDAAPDLNVEPRVEFAAVDDAKFLIGIPSIPFPVPDGNSTIKTPELAIIGRETQKGRTKIAVYATDAKTGELSFAVASVPKRRYYTRWTFLIFFTFRTTDLGKPF